MNRLTRPVALALTILLAGCSPMNIDDFQGKEPPLVLERFFDGDSEGWGIMQSRFGALQRQFRIDAVGRWDEAANTLHLTETYRFDDGQVDRLEWTIRRLDNGRYEGREPRLLEPAQGEQAGNAFHWTYRRNVPDAEGDTTLGFDDWFWLQPGDVLIARASVTKLGIEVATMSVFYRKR